MAILLFTIALAFSGALSQTPAPQAADFVTVLKGLGHYNGILGLIDAAGLTDTLKQAPNMTLLLPTDEAISKLPPGAVDDLKNNPQNLEDVLGYHAILSGAYKIRIRRHDRTALSSNNKLIRFNFYRLVNKTAVEGVEIVEQDIAVANGYVHGINGIMTPPTGNIVDIVTGRTDMSTLATLLTNAGLVDVIKNDQNITVFAPTNDAFAKVNTEVINYLSNHPDTMKEVLLYHVVNRVTLYSIGMSHSMAFPSADNHHDRLILIEDFSGNAYIDNAKISEKDISATNGVLHVIDDVLLPPRVVTEIRNSGINIG